MMAEVRSADGGASESYSGLCSLCCDIGGRHRRVQTHLLLAWNQHCGPMKVEALAVYMMASLIRGLLRTVLDHEQEWRRPGCQGAVEEAHLPRYGLDSRRQRHYNAEADQGTRASHELSGSACRATGCGPGVAQPRFHACFCIAYDDGLEIPARLQ
jgi:hypothetical protein